MLRNTRSTSMGLLDGLQSLQGAPQPQGNGNLSLPLSSSSTINSKNNGNNNNNDVNGNAINETLEQFSSSALSMFSDITNKVSTTLTPAVENINENAQKSVSQIRRMMGDESIDDIEAQQSAQQAPPQQITVSEEMSSMLNLTMFQRIGLFAMSFGTGILLIGMSFTFLPLIVIAPQKFAAAFTLGNVLAIVSTWILVGPKAQLQSMFSPGRMVAASVYVISLLVTLIAAFFGGKLRYIFVLIALVAEIGSLCWYALSYVPYGRQMISRLIGTVTG